MFNPGDKVRLNDKAMAMQISRPSVFRGLDHTNILTVKKQEGYVVHIDTTIDFPKAALNYSSMLNECWLTTAIEITES